MDAKMARRQLKFFLSRRFAGVVHSAMLLYGLSDGERQHQRLRCKVPPPMILDTMAAFPKVHNSAWHLAKKHFVLPILLEIKIKHGTCTAYPIPKGTIDEVARSWVEEKAEFMWNDGGSEGPMRIQLQKCAGPRFETNEVSSRMSNPIPDDVEWLSCVALC